MSTFGAVDLEREPGLHDGVLNQIEDAIEDLDDDAVLDDERIRKAVRTALRQALKAGARAPIIEVQITRLGGEACRVCSTRRSRPDDRPSQSRGDRGT